MMGFKDVVTLDSVFTSIHTYACERGRMEIKVYAYAKFHLYTFI